MKILKEIKNIIEALEEEEKRPKTFADIVEIKKTMEQLSQCLEKKKKDKEKIKRHLSALSYVWLDSKDFAESKAGNLIGTLIDNMSDEYGK